MTDSTGATTAILPDAFGWLVFFIVVVLALWDQGSWTGSSGVGAIRLASPRLVTLSATDATTAAGLLGASLEPWLGDDPQAGLR